VDVLLVLALATLRYVDEANLSKNMNKVAGQSILAAFVLSVTSTDATKRDAPVYLAYLGAVSVAVCLLMLGVGLVRGGWTLRGVKERGEL
jgi:hypothetical protein